MVGRPADLEPCVEHGLRDLNCGNLCHDEGVNSRGPAGPGRVSDVRGEGAGTKIYQAGLSSTVTSSRRLGGGRGLEDGQNLLKVR